MTPQDLLANFETLAESGNGIQRLRELVLELAVRGKLVEQDSGEECVQTLLTRIQRDRAARISSGELRAGRNPKPVSEAEVPFHCPSTWHWVRLEEYCHIEMGQSPGSEFYNSIKDGLPFYQGKTDFGAMHPTPRVWCNSPTKIAITRDVLVSVRAPVGPTNIAIERCCIGRGLAALRSLADSEPMYLLWALRAFERTLASKATGTTFVAISRQDLAELLIPVPPAREQHRIVDRVDELMALLDRLEAKHREREAARSAARDSALAALREATTPDDVETAWLCIQERFHELFATPEDVEPLRQAVLFVAGEGRLVPQDPREGSAIDLFNQIERADQPGRKRGVPRLKSSIPSPEPEGEPGVLPQGWAWASMEQCCEVVGGIQKTAARRPRNNPYPYLRVANVQRGRFDLSEVAQFELEPDELERWRLEPADLLIVEGNGSEDEIGRCAMWNGQIPNCVHQNHLIRCRAAIPTLAPYILHYLNSPQGISTMKSLAVTTSGLFNLSVGKIRSIRFPMPPEGEQHRILQRVGALMGIVEQLKTTLAKEYQLASDFAAAAVHCLEI